MNQVRVGVGILVYHDKTNQILLGKRKGNHAPGVWAPPGGHQEFGENWTQTTEREIQEECGDIVITDPEFFHVVNAYYRQEEKHYVTIYTKCYYIRGEIKNMEPDKCEGWHWFDVNNLPLPLMLSVEELLRQKTL